MLEFIVASSILISLILYVLMGGADFGAGMWDLLASGTRAAKQRKAIADAIGPIWEANHVWLILVIVLLFTGFPRGFSVMMTALNIPVTAMLIGIVLRGSAFIFRKYDSRADTVQHRWSTLFGTASFFTPFFQGVVLGALTTGQIRVEGSRVISGFFAGWLTPFAFTCGVFNLGVSAFLAATYLILEAEDQPDLQSDFRRRAVWSGLMLIPIGVVVFFISKRGAPELFQGLTSRWGPVLLGSMSLFAITALAALLLRCFTVSRIAAIGQVTLILVFWSVAQYPHLVMPDVTLLNARASEGTLRLLVMALGVGTFVLIPSLIFLFYIFKGKKSHRWKITY
ncbi:MAG: cytochrome d ubiquinol oxidase subunit II [Nitrospiria bacterium]